MIHRGSIVASPAYVPRTTGLAEDAADDDGRDQGVVGASQGSQEGRVGAAAVHVRLGEGLEHRERPGAGEAGGDARDGLELRHRAGADDPSNTPPENDPSLPATPKSTGRPVDLWDSGWPNGRFYWTVVPVRFESADPKQTTLAAATAPGGRAASASRTSPASRDAALPDRHRSTQETLTIASVDATTNQISTTTSATYAHGVGERRPEPHRDHRLLGSRAAAGRLRAPAASRRSARAARRSSPARPRPSSPGSRRRAG